MCGGFPCSGTSNSGNRQGLADPRSHCGQNISGLSTSVEVRSVKGLPQASLSSKTQQVYSVADLTKSCLTLTPSGTIQNGIVSVHKKSVCHTKESASLSLPTPMAYSTKSSRPPRQTKLEIRLRKYGSLMKTEAINPEFLRWLMGFPLE